MTAADNLRKMERVGECSLYVPGYVLGLHKDDLCETRGTVYKRGKDERDMLVVIHQCGGVAFSYHSSGYYPGYGKRGTGNINPDMWLVLETCQIAFRDKKTDPVRYGLCGEQ